MLLFIKKNKQKNSKYIVNLKYDFLKNIRDGFLIDSLTKKILENFIKKIYIYSGVIFGEKYLMEYLGPKLVENITWKFKSVFYVEHLSIEVLLYQIIFSIFFFNVYFISEFLILLLI